MTGDTAISKDFGDSMKATAPLVFAFVLILAFVLLLVSFRSIVIAAKAIVLNLLSVAAAFGVLVLVFQHGVGKDLLGFEYTGGVMAWLPVFLFVILFGLSMDYHVFILSRIREAHDGGMKTEDAIAYGIKSTAGVVTSAAVVMVFVFSIFGTMSLIMMKQFGVGLATAVLIDATIVRAVLLPATMKLLGEWNWYLPRWLAWLPKIKLEGPARARTAGARSMNRLLRPIVQPETYRRALFSLGQLGLGVAAFALLIAGWTVTLVLAITPLVVPLLIGLRIGVGLLAAAEASLARNLLGVDVRPRISTPGIGFWNRGFNVLRDGRSGSSRRICCSPGRWRSSRSRRSAGRRSSSACRSGTVGGQRRRLRVPEIDSFGRDAAGRCPGSRAPRRDRPSARAVGPAQQLAGLAAAGGRCQVIVRSPAERRALRGRALTIDALVSTVIVVGTRRDLVPDRRGLLLANLADAGALARRRDPRVGLPRPRSSGSAAIAMGSYALAIQIGVSAILSGFLVAIWAITTGGYFWPAWPVLALAVLALVHAAVLYARRQQRVEVLEASRAGAVDAQEAELRRIERDLHDGAQARLVALGMSLGMAEQKLQTDPGAFSSSLRRRARARPRRWRSCGFSPAASTRRSSPTAGSARPSRR